MRNNTLFKNENKPITPDIILKVTSLIYLKDALINEKYEDCTELIAAAKGFGAKQSEIAGVLEEHVRGKNSRPNEAKKGKASRRF